MIAISVNGEATEMADGSSVLDVARLDRKSTRLNSSH